MDDHYVGFLNENLYEKIIMKRKRRRRRSRAAVMVVSWEGFVVEKKLWNFKVFEERVLDIFRPQKYQKWIFE